MSNIMKEVSGKNYFEELLKIPDMNKYMSLLEKDKNGYLSYCMKKMKPIIKKTSYPKTEAEEGKYNNYIIKVSPHSFWF